MHDIAYWKGRALRAIPDWADQVAAYTAEQPHLLPQQPASLRAVAKKGLVILAVDRAAGDWVVGCIVLWPLGVKTHGAPWHELGTVFVREGYRRADHQGFQIADELYARVLREFPHLNILATTTAIEAVKLGLRAGLHHVGFRLLSDEVRSATCVCPSDKTHAPHPRDCTIRDQTCFVRVTPATWERLGRPSDIEFPVPSLVQVRSSASAR